MNDLYQLSSVIWGWFLIVVPILPAIFCFDPVVPFHPWSKRGKTFPGGLKQPSSFIQKTSIEVEDWPMVSCFKTESTLPRIMIPTDEHVFTDTRSRRLPFPEAWWMIHLTGLVSSFPPLTYISMEILHPTVRFFSPRRPDSEIYLSKATTS